MSFGSSCPANWFISLHTDRHAHRQTHAVHRCTHTCTNTQQRAPSLHNPVPLENSDLTELEVRSANTQLSGAFWIWQFLPFFPVESYRTSNHLKTSHKTVCVEKKDLDTVLNESRVWTHLQFLSECRAAPHRYFVSLLTRKYQLGDFQTEMFCKIFMIALLLLLFPVLFWIVNKIY